ncbi:MAG: hypothetical protein A3E84_00005 [Gammaproteobacteria bacterium RIFCSPHIGHO2_12_FULL_42_13]|nr:MAG: hypothetical protein A3E84_00005 [Gammaproteobacteria bacterium RIFCSPHIGHO2_12_FULL_42_13]
MKRKFLFGFVSLFFVFEQAQAVEFDRPIIVTIPTQSASQDHVSLATEEVALMNVKLTQQQKENLLVNDTSNSNHSFLQAKNKLPQKYIQGMNGVPVLNQGLHGTCVTFAVTAAIDAMLQKGDYVSQLCNLELGSYLANEGYLMSGWNGANGAMILDQIQRFGIINKQNQQTKSCAGITEYATRDSENTGNPMPLDAYKQLSENTSLIESDPILTLTQRFQWQHKNQASERILRKIKQYLVENKSVERDADSLRVVFGSFLLLNHCHVGACAKYHANEDTWALTEAIKNDSQPQIAGHEMIIIGYDDNAVAIDNEGKKHRGLLHLRNSWGDAAGDHGNYYMTYDYFKHWVMDADLIYYLGKPNGAMHNEALSRP